MEKDAKNKLQFAKIKAQEDAIKLVADAMIERLRPFVESSLRRVLFPLPLPTMAPPVPLESYFPADYHYHTWDDGTGFSHVHKNGDKPHGHHGCRYVLKEVK